MAKLIYSAIASLDGFIEDKSGRFDWAEPDGEVFEFINELERPLGSYLYGRRMYETMAAWETAPLDDGVPSFVRDFTRIWRAANKVVYSRTLESAPTRRTRIARSFDSEELRHLKDTSSRDLSIGGAELAGLAIEAGLVDELQLFAVPTVVGGGKPWLPSGVSLPLELLDSRRFAGGFVYLRYRTG